MTVPDHPGIAEIERAWLDAHAAPNPEAARRIAWHAREAYPDQPIGYIGQCWHYLRTGQAAELLATALAGRALADGYDFHVFACTAQEQLGAGSAARDSYLEAAGRHPDRALGWAGAARLAAAAGQMAEARRLLCAGFAAVEPAELPALLTTLQQADPLATPWPMPQALRAVADLARCPAMQDAFVAHMTAHLPPTERTQLLQALADTLPGSDAVIEAELRTRFDARDFSFGEERFLGFALRNAATSGFRLLWIERLLGTRQIIELARFLSEHATMLTGSDLGMQGTLLVIEAVAVCQQAGLLPEFDLAAVPTGDSRIRAAIATYQVGDPLRPFRAAGERPVPPRFSRLYPFIHQGWNAPATPFWTGEISAVVLDAVVRKTPFSLIRLGDGEGNFLRWQTPTLINATARRTADHQVVTPEVDRDTYAGLHALLLGMLAEADVLGVPNEFMAEIADDWATVNRTLAGLTLQGMLTDHPVHYALAQDGCLERIVALQLLSRMPVVYIGPHDPARFTGLAVPFDAAEHWRIPGEAYYLIETLEEAPHYPDHYDRIMARIDAMQPGTLVLISAGLLGKIYAGAIRRKGGMAIDIGAVSDQWAGRTTRIYASQAGAVTSGHDSITAMLRGQSDTR